MSEKQKLIYSFQNYTVLFPDISSLTLEIVMNVIIIVSLPSNENQVSLEVL